MDDKLCKYVDFFKSINRNQHFVKLLLPLVTYARMDKLSVLVVVVEV